MDPLPTHDEDSDAFMAVCFHLQDVRAFVPSIDLLGKGEGENATVSDEQLALKLYYEDLQNRGSSIADRMLARDLSRTLGGTTMPALLGQQPMVAREETGARRNSSTGSGCS